MGASWWRGWDPRRPTSVSVTVSLCRRISRGSWVGWTETSCPVCCSSDPFGKQRGRHETGENEKGCLVERCGSIPFAGERVESVDPIDTHAPQRHPRQRPLTMEDVSNGSRRVVAPQCSAPELGLRCYHAQGKDWDKNNVHEEKDPQEHHKVRPTPRNESRNETRRTCPWDENTWTS